MRRALRRFGIQTGEQRLRVDPSTAKTWWLLGALAVLAVPVGISIERYTQIDVDALLLYGALLAAAYAGYQAYRTRLNSLMPVLVVHHSYFVPLDPYAEDLLREGRRTLIEIRRDDLGLKVEVENIGPGPALVCHFKGWLQPLAKDKSPLVDPDPAETAALKEGPPHFEKELAGVPANSPAHDSPWVQPQPSTYKGILTGGFWLHWALSYSDVFGRKYTVWGAGFFVSPIGAELQIPVNTSKNGES